MGKLGAFATVVFLASVLSFQTQGAEFYVDSFATLAGMGSLSSPFKSIQEGLNLLKAGDTLYIRGDTLGSGRIYSETPIFPVGGMNGSPITVRNFSEEKVIVSTAEMIRFDKDFLVIKGLIFDHQKAEVDAIRWLGNNINLSECEIRNGSRDGIDVSARAKNVTISNCVIHDFIWADPARRDAHCIVANPGVIGLRITGNTIYDCSGDGIQLFARDSTSVSSYVSDVLIERNKIYSTLGENSENGLDFKGGRDVIVRRNEIHGFTSNKAAVVQKEAQNIRFEENIIYDSARGLEFRSEGRHFQQNVTVVRNVVFNITEQYALKFDGVFNAQVLHNTVHRSMGSSIRIELKGMKSGMIKNNLIHLSGAPSISKSFSGEYSHNGWFSSSAGALASSRDTVGIDPLFADAGAKDFRLTSKSTALDKGVDVGFLFMGEAPDLGAYESPKYPIR